MFHSFFNVSALIIENLLLLTFDIILKRRKFPANVSVHINSGLMSIFWTQKVKLFYTVLLANNSH